MTDRPLILMIDDNVGDLELVRIAMEYSGIDADLRTFMDGKESQDVLLALPDEELERIRLVLLDLNMPRLSGHELLAWAHTQERLRHLPIVILTSSNVAKDRESCLAAGATDYWIKPHDFDAYLQLTDRMRDYLHAHQFTDTGRHPHPR